jgi:hypothetical protein
MSKNLEKTAKKPQLFYFWMEEVTVEELFAYILWPTSSELKIKFDDSLDRS